MKTILGSSIRLISHSFDVNHIDIVLQAVKIATGGIGGSEYSGNEYNIISKALYCSAVDILSVHSYFNQASQWEAYIPKLADQGAAQGKYVMVEEWGVGTDSSFDSIATLAAVFNNAGVP